MAIKQTIKIQNEQIEVQDAYLVITNIIGTKEEVDIYLSGYISRADYKNNNSSIYTDFISFKPDTSDTSERWDKQAYRHILTLDKYKTAQLILEDGQVA
jgi:translation initiation factor RLI1